MNIYWKRILDFLTGKIPTIDAETLSAPSNSEDASEAPQIPTAEAQHDGETQPEEEKESCPIATRRLIREAMQQLHNFTEEHRLTATVAKALLAILAEIAISALQGRVNTQVLEVIKRVIRHDQARLFNYPDPPAEPAAEAPAPIEDDGLPHFINTPFAARQSFFQLADEARL